MAAAMAAGSSGSTSKAASPICSSAPLSALPFFFNDTATTESAPISAMVRPRTRTLSAWALSRLPPQCGQVFASWYCRRKTRMYCL